MTNNLLEYLYTEIKIKEDPSDENVKVLCMLGQTAGETKQKHFPVFMQH